MKLLILIMESILQVTKKLGHVVQIDVCGLLKRASKSHFDSVF